MAKTGRCVYNTPYVRNPPITVVVTEANGRGNVVERPEHPDWRGRVCYRMAGVLPKRHGAEHPESLARRFPESLELFQKMINIME